MATRTFRGTIDSDWNTLGNWLELAVPTAADDVVFDAVSPACTLSANGACLTLDQTGFLSTLTLNTFQIAVSGTLFRLVAAGWVKGSHAQEVDFIAAAGTVLITTAGNEINSVRFGNVATTAIWRLQDPLTVTVNFNFNRGTFETNNQNILVKNDMLWNSTLAVGSFKAGSSTIEIQRNFNWQKGDVMNSAATYGTSTFKFTGAAGQWIFGNFTMSFYAIELAPAGGTTTLTATGALPTINVYRSVTTGAGGTVGWNGVAGNGISVLSPLASPLMLGAGTIWKPPIIIKLSATGAGLTQNIPAQYFESNLTFASDLTYATENWNLTGNLRCGSLILSPGGAIPHPRYITFNGFTLTVDGSVQSTIANSAGWTFLVGSGSLLVGTSFQHRGMTIASSEHRILSVSTGGTVSIGTNFTVTGTAGYDQMYLDLKNGAVMTVGGNWTISGLVTPLLGGAYAGAMPQIRFTSAGNPTITASATDIWPKVVFSIGGSCTLYNGFDCWDLDITSGLITAGNPFTVRSSLTNAGTFTGSANMNIGSSFVNTGAVVMAGSSVRMTSPLASISGFNPVTLRMANSCLRLQLLGSMNITTFILEDRIVPGVVQFLAGGTFNIGTMNSQIVSTDGSVQFISSAAGTRYVWNVTAAITSIANIWPRDNNASGSAVAPVGNLTNKDLGNNLGWSLYFPAYLRVITDDPGEDILADSGIGSMQYCWLVADSLVALTALATAFGTGANNWHRKTNIPFAMLDNLNKGATYYIALGLVDDRNRRLTPNVGAGDFASGVATSSESGGGGAHNITVSPQWALQG